MGWNTSRKLALAAVLTVALAGASPVVADDLAVAVKTRDTNQVLALLKGGADPNQHSSYGAPINLAAALGPPEIVVALLDAGADLQVRGFGGESPLHAAALAGQPIITRILVERGAQVDALDNLGRTPLLTYASGAAYNVVVLQILLKAGADPNAAEHTSKMSALDYIAIRGRTDEAEMLVMAGANVNAKDSLYGETPLHYATDCWNSAVGNHDLVRFLIAHGADVNAKDFNGYTPLGYVQKCTSHSGLMVDILGKAGAH
jgi:ankyrin repeat protein